MGNRELAGAEKIASPFVREVTERFAHGAQLGGDRVTGALLADRQQVREPRAILSSWLVWSRGDDILNRNGDA
jgi:hypothetical protein